MKPYQTISINNDVAIFEVDNKNITYRIIKEDGVFVDLETDDDDTNIPLNYIKLMCNEVQHFLDT